MIIRPSIRRKDTKLKTATGAVDYVLSAFDYERKKRVVEPKIREGDPDLIKSYDNHRNSPKNNKSTSGVIAFRDKENLTEEQKTAFIERFKELSFGRFVNKVDMLFVEHNDKNNLEFHFIIPHLTNEGKAFNAYSGYIPNGRKLPLWCEANLAVQRVLNDEFGLDQVVDKNKKKGLDNDEFKLKKYSKEELKQHLTDKQKIAKIFMNDIRNGHINNRTELIEEMKAAGLTIKRQGDNYISIKNPKGGKNIRFEGGVFSTDKQAYTDLQQQKTIVEVNSYTAQDKAKDLRTIDLYQRFLVDRYENKRQNTTALTKQFTQHIQIDKSATEPTQASIKRAAKPDLDLSKDTMTSAISMDFLSDADDGGTGGGSTYEEASSAYEEAVRLYGANSPQALQAKAMMSMAQAREEQQAEQASKARYERMINKERSKTNRI